MIGIVAIILLELCCHHSLSLANIVDFNFLQCCRPSCWGQSLPLFYSSRPECSVLTGRKGEEGGWGCRGAASIWGTRVQRFFQWVSHRRGGCLRLQMESGQLFKLVPLCFCRITTLRGQSRVQLPFRWTNQIGKGWTLDYSDIGRWMEYICRRAK